MNGDELDLSFGAHLRRLRWKLGSRFGELTQTQFAQRFGLSLGTLRDAEQGRTNPSWAMRVLVAAVELDPALIDRAVVLARERERVEAAVKRRC